MRPGLVTTILPVYNRAAMLREAAATVLTQTYRKIELIIVDDGSTDETGAVADELAARHPEIVRVIHQANAGVGPARETGRLAAQGEFIQHLATPEALARETLRLLNDPVARANLVSRVNEIVS